MDRHEEAPVFPGEIAGASLKQPHFRDIASVTVRFPGEIAGASLKRLESEALPRLALEIPRRNRRGLIEAPRLTLEGEVLADSPAKSPGPH